MQTSPATTLPSEKPLHALAIAEAYVRLGSAPQGLSQSEAAQRLRLAGPNVIHEVKGKPLWQKFLANFTHLMALLLWAGGLIAFVAHLPQLGVAVWLVNLINGSFSFWQEYRAERATAALRRLMPTYAVVLRDGKEHRIVAEELVPGDVILLAEGDHISADARLLQETELRVDQSTLTGESHPVRKSSDAVLNSTLSHLEIPNLVFAGTSVTSGSARAVVFATGMHSEFGKIAGLTQSMSEESSPLQQEMRHVTRTVSFIAMGCGVVFFILALALAGMELGEGFLFALGMIVAFVPEGLLPTVTLALALGVQRMARRHALVKRLSAVETLGCTTVICTDKTGTLTQNEMTVCQLWIGGQFLTVTGVGYDPQGRIMASPTAECVPEDADATMPSSDIPGDAGDLRQLLVAASLCNNARFAPPSADTATWTVLGDPTEAALRVVALKGGVDPEREVGQTPRWRELPFDARRKCMSTIHQAQDCRLAYVKGAPREMLALCTQVLQNGQACPMPASLRQQITAANDHFARLGLRVLAVAMRCLPADLSLYTPATVECELTFLGLLAMMDPPRLEVPEAVRKCHRAGIRIIMMTGDYGLTAESIARRIGILRYPELQPRIISGAELDRMDEPQLREALQHEVIFARVAPEHKLRVVSALQACGHVVAVTGDGVNDAPALKKADIGVAMGRNGTDVAKEAASIVLTDDNFASIVNAVEEGRAVYANIKKFTSYIFTSNTPEAVPFIIFALSQGRIPLALNIMHILSVDLGTDMVPALALGAEAPEDGVMDRPPRNRQEHVITRSLLLRAYLWLGPLQSLATMAAFYWLYWTQGYWGQWLDLPANGALYQSATGMALAAVVTTQIGNLFAHRTERNSFFTSRLFDNRLIWIGLGTELLFLAAILYVPWLQDIIGTAAFPWPYWGFLFAWSPALLLVDEGRKALLRWRERGTTGEQG